MQLFYAPDLNTSGCVLPEDEARHCIKVLRKSVGDTITVTNGTGSLFEMQLLTDNYKNCELGFVQALEAPMQRNYSLTMVVAPTKQTERFEWFLEKATEMGIDRIIPVITARSERSRLKPERLERILVSAMKQSGRVYLPQLDELKPLKQVLKELPEDALNCIATCDGERKALQQVYEKGRNVVIFIGPEGDFTPQEVQQCMDAGCVAVSLGPARLRVETAALAACHTINLMNE